MHEQHNNFQNESMIELSADAFVSLVVQELKTRQIAALPTLAQMNVEFVPSEQFGQSIAQQQCKFNKAQNRGKRLRSLRRTLLVAAVTIAIISCLMLPVAAVRKAIVQTFIDWQEKFALISFTTDAASPELSTSERIDIAVNYLPEGYVLEEVSNTEMYCYLFAQTEADAVFTIEVAVITSGNTISVDNEYTSYYTIFFDEKEALWMPDERGTSLLLWTDGVYRISIFSTLELTEVLKIAKSITC